MLERYLRKNFGKYVPLGEFKDDSEVERALKHHRIRRRALQIGVSALIMLPVIILALTRYGGGKGSSITIGPDDLYARGKRAFEQGRYEAATEYLQEAIDGDLDEKLLLDAYLKLADSNYNITWRDREQTYKEALKYYNNALDAGSKEQRAPHRARIYYQMGNCQRNVRAFEKSFSNTYDSAIDYYDTVVRDFASSDYAPKALYYRAECYRSSRKFREARQTFVVLCEKYPDHELSKKAFFRVGDCFIEEASDIGSESYPGTVNLKEVSVE